MFLGLAGRNKILPSTYTFPFLVKHIEWAFSLVYFYNKLSLSLYLELIDVSNHADHASPLITLYPVADYETQRDSELRRLRLKVRKRVCKGYRGEGERQSEHSETNKSLLRFELKKHRQKGEAWWVYVYISIVIDGPICRVRAKLGKTNKSLNNRCDFLPMRNTCRISILARLYVIKTLKSGDLSFKRKKGVL